MAQKYYQQTVLISGQTATHSGIKNWLLLLEVGDIIIVGEQRAAITSIDAGNTLTFLGALPGGTQKADFEVSNKSVFYYYPDGTAAAGNPVITPERSYPSRTSCVRCDIGSQGEQGKQGVAGIAGPQGEPGNAATSLDALTDVVATPVVDGQAYTLLRKNGTFTLAPAVEDVTDEWVTNW